MSRYSRIDKLEIIKYCNKNIEILLAMEREINNQLLNLLNDGVLDYETYDKIVNVKLLGLRELLEERYEPEMAKILWECASRSMLSIKTIRLYEFRLAKKIAVDYLGRQQFYRQNNLPVELNLMIEEEISKETDAKLADKVIFYALEKAGLVGPMGKRDVWYYGEDYRLNDAPEELKRAMFDTFFLPCTQRQHGRFYDPEHTAQHFSYHFSCLRSPEELKQFTNQMLEIIEKVSTQRNQERQQAENQNSDQSNNSSTENNVPESQTYQTENSESNRENPSTTSSSNENISERNDVYSNSESNSSYTNSNNYSSSSFAPSSSTETSNSARTENKTNFQPNNFVNSETSSSTEKSNSAGSVYSGGLGGFVSSNGGNSPVVASEKPKSKKSEPIQPPSLPKISISKQPSEQTLNELTKQKQQISEQIQAKLDQSPDLKNLSDFANWKQEIEQAQSLEAIRAYQKNLLERMEKKEQFLAANQVISSSSTKHDKNSILPLIIFGIVFLGIISLSTILIVRKNINRKDKL